MHIQATNKGSDQTEHMRRLIWGFAGRTYTTLLEISCYGSNVIWSVVADNLHRIYFVHQRPRWNAANKIKTNFRDWRTCPCSFGNSNLWPLWFVQYTIIDFNEVDIRIYLPSGRGELSLFRVDKSSCLPKLKSITVLLYDFSIKNENFLVEFMFNLQSKDFLTSFINCY